MNDRAKHVDRLPDQERYASLRALARDEDGFSMQAIMITGVFVVIAAIAGWMLINRADDAADRVDTAIDDTLTDLETEIAKYDSTTD